MCDKYNIARGRKIKISLAIAFISQLRCASSSLFLTCNIGVAFFKGGGLKINNLQR